MNQFSYIILTEVISLFKFPYFTPNVLFCSRIPHTFHLSCQQLLAGTDSQTFIFADTHSFTEHYSSLS